MVTFPKVYATSMESPTLLYSSQFNRGMMVTFPKVYRMPHTVISRFNRGTMIAYLKVYVISMEGLAQHMASSVQYDDQS